MRKMKQRIIHRSGITLIVLTTGCFDFSLN